MKDNKTLEPRDEESAPTSKFGRWISEPLSKRGWPKWLIYLFAILGVLYMEGVEIIRTIEYQHFLKGFIQISGTLMLISLGHVLRNDLILPLFHKDRHFTLG